MKRSMFAGALLVGLAGFALAQERTDFTPIDFTFRGGVAIPLDDELIESTPAAFALGVDYRMEYSFVRNGETFFSWDWIRSRRGINVIAYNQKLFTGPSAFFEGEGYVFIGIGGAWYGTINLNEASLAVRGGIGVELNERLVIELGGSAAPDQDGVNPSNIFLTLGYRT